MNIVEAIKQLERIRAEHGDDVELCANDGGYYGGAVEPVDELWYNDGNNTVSALVN